MQSVFGLSRRLCNSQADKMLTDPLRRKPVVSVQATMRKRVTEYFLRDDVSRITTGKKETRTQHGRKEQKRLLTEHMKSLFVKFQAEHPQDRISYTVFCRLRPFWVVAPSMADRNTCLCKLHDNTAFLANKMKQLKLFKSDDLDELVKDVSCDVTSTGNCSSCKDCVFDMPDHDQNQSVKWTQWKTKSEERDMKVNGKLQTRTVTLTLKDEVRGTVGDLVDEMKGMMTKFKQHIFNVRNQYAFHRSVRRRMSNSECLVHIDFSENYAAKLSSEIQSMALHY